MVGKKEVTSSRLDVQISGDVPPLPNNFSTNIEVRFRDLDALGHVNNAVYLTYFETARLHYWTALLGHGAFSQHSFVVVRAECNYRSPAHLGETLKVCARVNELKNTSFVFSYEIFETLTSRLVADGLTVQVCIDSEKKKARLIPDELRRRIVEFENDAQRRRSIHKEQLSIRNRQ